MTTAVASPPSFQSLPRLGWNGGNSGSGGFASMSSDEVSRMFMPQRKVLQRSSSSSSLSSTTSTGSSSSTVTVAQPDGSSNGEASHAGKKKARGGFWPVTKSESTSGVTNARANGSVQPSGTAAGAKNQLQPALPSQNAQANGSRTVNGQASMEGSAVLALLPMNGTFERKQINVPFFPEVLRVGRQTNAKTVPTPVNGFFDSKVLSRQHAEVWAERNGKVFIRDVKSSNGTFVNGQRLSPENRESEPHELHQHDTLELGIDIVSEDQKTIVHHKVSAKVEYVGLPGSSNNVLDLSFGDLDPSHGGSLLPSPMSAPMVHSRSRPGGPVTNGRASTPSSVVGSQMSSMAQQRQLNFWGAPLNVEQLVKSLSTEMRIAKQQASELEQAGTFLTAVLSPDDSPGKNHSPSKEAGQSKQQSNGRVKAPRVDHLTRFADPPAPPPQQPLPEKPDSAKSSPVNSMPFGNLLRRSDTAKPGNSPGGSPTSPQNSQILALIEALTQTKKELDSQGARVKELEDMLKRERSAREDAEERARRLELHTSARPIPSVEESAAISTQEADFDSAEQSHGTAMTEDDGAPGDNLQQRLDHMVAEMQRMKLDMDQFQRRAEVAESDATKAETSLADMIKKLREEDNKDTTGNSKVKAGRDPKENNGEEELAEQEQGDESRSLLKRPSQANGHVRVPKLPEHLERAVTTVLRDSNYGNGEMMAQSAPYVSMLGVVLIGVGLMAYLNSWQKSER